MGSLGEPFMKKVTRSSARSTASHTEKPGPATRRRRIIIIAAAALALLAGTWFFVSSDQKGKIKKDIERYHSRVDRYPEDPENYKELSSLYAKLGDTANSEKYYDYYQRALKAGENKDARKRAQELDAIRNLAQRPDNRSGGNINEGKDGDAQKVKAKTETVDSKADDATKKAVAAYNKGIEYLNAAQFKQAKDKFQEAIDAKPDYAKAYTKLGKAHLEMAEIQPAQTATRKALSLDPKDDEAHFDQGEIYRETKNYPAAEDSYHKSIDYNPNNFMAYFRLGNLKFRDKKYAEARDFYNESYKLKNDYYKTSINLGSTYFRMGDMRAAEQNLNRALGIDAIQKDPASLNSVYSQLGKIYASLRDHQKAIDFYQKAIAIQRNPNDFYQMGLSAEATRNPQKAKEYYQSALKEKDDFPDARFNLGTLFFNEGSYGEALKHYNQIIQANPSYILALVQAGKCNVELGSADQSKTLFEQALAIDPNHPTANLEIGRYWKNKGIMDKAVSYVQTALANTKVAEDRVVPLSELGLIYLKFKLYDDAEKNLLQARSLNPSNPEVLQNLGKLYFQVNKMDEAANVYETIIKIVKNDWESYETLGNIQVKLGKKAEAKATLSKLLELNPNYRNKAKVDELLKSL